MTLIRGEKKSLRTLIEMAEYALGLLSKPTKAEAKAAYQALGNRPIYAEYIEHELFTLFW